MSVTSAWIEDNSFVLNGCFADDRRSSSEIIVVLLMSELVFGVIVGTEYVVGDELVGWSSGMTWRECADCGFECGLGRGSA